MNSQQRFTIQSALVALIVNGILLAAIVLLVGTSQPVLLFAIGAVGTIILVAAIAGLARGAWQRDHVPAETPHVPQAAVREEPEAPPAAPVPAMEAQPAAPTAAAGAVQMLAIFQREGRLIDFLQEDLRMYDDAQIGAAVRTIHEGCRQALREHITLEPVFQEPEGSSVTVQPGFDPRAIRLTGDVLGEPPFRGELRHRGWRVLSIDLPTPGAEQDSSMILAAAQVEVR